MLCYFHESKIHVTRHPHRYHQIIPPYHLHQSCYHTNQHHPFHQPPYHTPLHHHLSTEHHPHYRPKDWKFNTS